jgi:hypothetical protein
MRTVEKYIFFYGTSILLSGLILMYMDVQPIEIYYTVYLIEFLVAAELASPFRRSLRRDLRPIILVFLAGFIYILAVRVLQILG